MWAKHAKKLGTYEYIYGMGYWIPNLPLYSMSKLAKFYYKHNVKMYHAEMHPIWAFDAPKARIRAKLLWNHDLDVNKELHRYCNAAFGDAGQAMFKFYHKLVMIREKRNQAENSTTMWPEYWRNSSQFSQISPEIMSDLSKLLAKADTYNLTELEQKRLQMVKTYWSYTDTLFKIFQLAQNQFNIKSKADTKIISNLNKLQEKAKTVFAEIKKHPEWHTGTSTTPNVIDSRRWQKLTSWSIDAEVKNAILTSEYKSHSPQYFPKGKIEDELLRLHPRKKHPWYKPALYSAIKNKATKNGITLEMDDTSIKITPQEHIVFQGKRKKCWASYLAVKVPITEADICKINFSGTANDGELHIVLNVGYNNRSYPQGQIIEKCVGTKSFNKQIIFKPLSSIPAEKMKNLGKCNINVYVVWKPFSDKSKLTAISSLNKIFIKK